MEEDRIFLRIIPEIFRYSAFLADAENAKWLGDPEELMLKKVFVLHQQQPFALRLPGQGLKKLPEEHKKKKGQPEFAASVYLFADPQMGEFSRLEVEWKENEKEWSAKNEKTLKHLSFWWENCDQRGFSVQFLC